jgi:intracellular sulfur oxidation DsrE/DsrF family protein
MPTAKAVKVGILISAQAGTSSFDRGLVAAENALHDGSQVYLYCIDNGVEGLNDGRLPKLKNAGVHLFACAYSLQRRGLNAPPEATLAGLTILSDIMASAGRFESFN